MRAALVLLLCGRAVQGRTDEDPGQQVMKGKQFEGAPRSGVPNWREGYPLDTDLPLCSDTDWLEYIRCTQDPKRFFEGTQCIKLRGFCKHRPSKQLCPNIDRAPAWWFMEPGWYRDAPSWAQQPVSLLQEAERPGAPDGTVDDGPRSTNGPDRARRRAEHEI